MAKTRRRWLWVAGLLGLALIVYGALLFTSKPVDEVRARELATGRFHRYAQAARIDPGLFKGPQPASAVNVPYGFRWTYSDEQGQIVIYVWVEESGWTEIAIDGATERLRTPSPQG
jgi:hypothetical protein